MGAGKCILVADDDQDLVDLLKLDLTHEGYEILTALDGKEALQILNSQKVDLVILDVMMPYVDGYHVAYELTSHPAQGALPKILILTSRDVTEEREIAKLSGADVLIQKPFDMEDLHQWIRELLGSAVQNREGNLKSQ